MPGMITSARTTSGRASRAFATASSPLSTVIRTTSSLAKLIPTTFWIVTLSSASSSFLAMFPPVWRAQPAVARPRRDLLDR
jgi:hypothetical protein